MSSTEVLLDAIRRGDKAAVWSLLEREPELVRARGSSGGSPVMAAIYHGAGSILAMLVARGAEVDIFAAAALGSVERIAEVLESDPEQVHAFSPEGWTPLHLSTFFGHKEATALLLDHGADVRTRSRNAMDDGSTPALIAETRGKALVAEVLRGRAPTPAPA